MSDYDFYDREWAYQMEIAHEEEQFHFIHRHTQPYRRPNMSKFNSAELTSQVNNHIENLAKLTNEAARSAGIKQFLDTCARFHQYSPCNIDLIHSFCPHASRVAGFRKWNELNRYVRRGEQGIPILAPLIYKSDPEDEDSKRLRGFRVVYVFDVSQTDGEPLPEAPNWKSLDRQLQLENRLIQFANSKGITVDRGELPGEAQGMSTGGKIVLIENAGTKTLVHEIAHELLHQGNNKNWSLSSAQRELEAEAIAYVVGSHFGLEDLASPNYLALWEADADAIRQKRDRIQKTACEIIEAISE